MRLRRLLSPKRLARLGTALRLARHWPAAGRLLAGHLTEWPAAPMRPYEALLVADLRRVAARLARTGNVQAVRAVAAAYLECRRRGWSCTLQADDAPAPRFARLALWGAPVLEAGDPAQATRCMAKGGHPLPSVAPRRPTSSDGRVAQVRSERDVAADLNRLLAQLGGLQSTVSPGDGVLLKANFNSWHQPPASSSFDLMAAVVAALRESGAGRIALGECSAIALGRTRRVLRRAGVLAWAAGNDVEVCCFDEEPWQACAVPGKWFSEIIVPACLPEFDRIIYLICAKTHQEAGVSLGLKMTVGFMHPAQRLELHRDHLLERIAETSLAVRPDLAVLDARTCFITGGPAVGTIAEPGVLLAARQLEPLEEAGLRVLAEHGAVGVELGREQLERSLLLKREAGGDVRQSGEEQ